MKRINEFFKNIISTKKGITVLICSLVVLISITTISIFIINNKLSSTNICTVSFETSGGNKIKQLDIKCGKKIEQLETPVKEGFDFKYWLYDGERVDFNSFVINDNIILNAYWEANEDTDIVVIHFDTQGGTLIDDIEITRGTKLTQPLTPIKDGYEFKNWIHNNQIFDFTENVNDNITLVAEWAATKDLNTSTTASNQTTGSNVISGYYNDTTYEGWPFYGYRSGSKEKCSGGFRSDVPEKTVTVGYSDHVNWTWSTGGGYSSNNNECFVTYKSSNKQVATVSSSGIINTVSDGKVYIYQCLNDTASAKELLCFKGKLIVEKSNNIESDDSGLDNEETENDNIIYNEVSLINCRSEYIMEVGDTQIVRSEISPSDYSPTTFTWSSSDSNIVSIIDNNIGKVKALNVGEIWLTLTAANGVWGSCPIKVVEKQVHVNNVSLNESKINIERGTTKALVATVSPSNATDSSLTWITSDSSVATVDSNGNVTGLKKGTAIITVFSTDGDYAASCEVNVIYNEVEGINISKNSVSMYVGDYETLTATVIPSDANNQNVWWSSSDTSVVSVSSSGVITAMGAGTAIVTVTSAEGEYKAHCNVTVHNVKVNGLSLNKNNLTLIKGNAVTLTATVTPNNATVKDVLWSSSDTSIATVNTNGGITAINKGTATITATSLDGSYSSSCVITVQNPPISISTSVGVATIASNGNLSRGISVVIQANGGSGVYPYYSIKLYKDNTLIGQSYNTTVNELFIPGYTNGSYHVDVEVRDSDGDVYTGASGVTTISGF